MREIKFRAWNPENNIMGSIFDLEWFKQNIGPADWKEGFRTDYWFGQKIVFLQYTGLTDKNGKEIYEGDVLSQNFANEMGSYTPSMGAIIFCKNEAMFQVEYGDNHFSVGTNSEIIGNIYENPDLLGK